MALTPEDLRALKLGGLVTLREVAQVLADLAPNAAYMIAAMEPEDIHSAVSFTAAVHDALLEALAKSIEDTPHVLH